MKKVFLTATLISVAMACLAAISSLSGKWSGTIKLPDGNSYPVAYELQISGTQLTGTATSEGSPKPISDGKIDGDNFSFNLADEDGSVIKHTGKYYAQGDSVSLSVNYQGTALHATLTRPKN